MGRHRNKILLALLSVNLAGCAKVDNFASVPYDLRGPKVIVAEHGTIAQNDLQQFANSVPSAASLARGYLQIRNIGDRSIHLRVRALPGDWTDFTIPSGESTTFICTNCSERYVQVAIPTEGQDTIVRTIDLQARYELYWDNFYKRWDLRPISNS